MTVADEIQDFGLVDFLAGNDVISEMSCGGFVRLSLPENPTTGYRWTFSAGEKGSTGPLEVVYDRYEADSDMIGSGGMRYVTIAANAPGTYSLNFGDVRSWEDNSNGTYYTLAVNV